MVCVRGFEFHLCRLVFKNWWTEFVKHKNWYLPNFVTNSQRNLSGQKILEKQLAHQLLKFIRTVSQATKPWKISSFFMQKIGWPMYTFFYWNHSSMGKLKNFRFFCWPSFSMKNYSFSVESVQVSIFPRFLFCFVFLFKSSNRLLRKTWNFSETIWSIKRFELVQFYD